jgi:TonB system transport protein ExbD (group 1)
MAAKLDSSSLGGGHADAFPDNNEINVTPFVDIMLVLLIIFMVAAPLATVDVKVDLPKSSAKPEPNPEDPIFISIKNTNQVYLGNNEVSLSALGPLLLDRAMGNRETRVYIRADKTVRYKEVSRVIGVIQDQGFYKAALVAEDSVTAQ